MTSSKTESTLNVSARHSNRTADNSSDQSPDIETISSQIVYENRWMRVREDQIRRKSGQTGIYGVVEKADFAVIAAIQDGQIMLVQQYRYPVRSRHWELPQGSWEASEISPLELAKAELQEETGLQAAHMQQVGHLYLGYGYSTQAYDIFLAQDLTQGDTRKDMEEEDLIARWFPLEQVKTMIREGELMDATTVAVLGLLTMQGHC